MSNPISWGADTPVSMPGTIDPTTPAEDLGGGYVFTTWGLAHNFTTSDAEVFYQPAYAPLPSEEGAIR